MSARLLDVSLRGAAVLFGAMWLLAAGTKTWDVLPAYEFTARVVPPGGATVAALAATVAVETALGAGMVLGLLRGFVPTCLGLLAALGALWRVKVQHDGRIPCGCFSTFAETTVDEAIVRNVALAGVAAALAMVAFARDRSAQRGGS